MIDDDNLLSFAQSCALEYCKRFGSKELEDATQDAAIILLSFRAYWDRPRNYLRKRVIFELVRKFQNEKGLRRKNRLRKVELDLSGLSEKKSDETQTAKAREMIAQAVQNGRLEYAREIVELFVDGWKRKDVARLYGVSFREISEIYDRFVHELKKLDDGDHDQDDYPLFNLKNKGL